MWSYREALGVLTFGPFGRMVAASAWSAKALEAWCLAKGGVGNTASLHGDGLYAAACRECPP